MTWQTLIIIAETVGLAVAAIIAGASRMRAIAMTDRAREYRAAIGFARLQPSPRIACRFLRLWQDGDLDVYDPQLFAEWTHYRCEHFRNWRAA